MTNREKIEALSGKKLASKVRNSNSFAELYRNLEVADNGTLREVVKNQLDKYKIKTSHFGSLKEEDIEYIEKIRQACKVSKSVYGVIKNLGLRSTGSRHQEIKRIIKNNKIDISHFTGRASNRLRFKKPLNELLQYDTEVESSHLKKRILQENIIENKCSRCNISEWQGEKLSLILDHISGDRRDNRLENLRLLCPNCNSLTDTFSGRNIGKVKTGE